MEFLDLLVLRIFFRHGVDLVDDRRLRHLEMVDAADLLVDHHLLNRGDVFGMPKRLFDLVLLVVERTELRVLVGDLSLLLFGDALERSDAVGGRFEVRLVELKHRELDIGNDDVFVLALPVLIRLFGDVACDLGAAANVGKLDGVGVLAHVAWCRQIGK